MLDEEWLKSLRCDVGGTGYTIKEFLGVGADSIAFRVGNGTDPDLCLNVIRHNLGFYIREIPPCMSTKKEYDVDRLNKKLRRLIGNNLIDQMCGEYHYLYNYLVNVLYSTCKKGIPELSVFATTLYINNPNGACLILKSPGMRRRLVDLEHLEANSSKDDNSIINLENYVKINGAFEDIEKVKQWSSILLKSIEVMPNSRLDTKPNKFSLNPLIVWGAAVMDGFFSIDEIPVAAAYIRESFGEISSVSNPDSTTWKIQAMLLANLCSQRPNGRKEAAERFQKFCAELGFTFPVYDHERGCLYKPEYGVAILEQLMK